MMVGIRRWRRSTKAEAAIFKISFYLCEMSCEIRCHISNSNEITIAECFHDERLQIRRSSREIFE